MAEDQVTQPGVEQAGPSLRRDDSGETVLVCLPALAAYLPLVGTLVQWFGHRAGLDDEKAHDLEVAVDEACTNVVRHGFPEGTPGEMTVTFATVDQGLRVTIADKGRRFSPAQGLKVARAKRLLDPASGGSGLLLIGRLTDGTEYHWDAREGNRLSLVKHR